MGQGVYRLSIQRLSPDASLDGLPHSPREALHSPNLHTLSPNVTGYSAWHSPTSCGSGERTACCESGESITSSAALTSTGCRQMPQVVSCDIHRLRVRNGVRACRLRVRNRGEACQDHVAFREDWRHLTPHKCPLIYLCGKPFDSSHFDAIAEAD